MKSHGFAVTTSHRVKPVLVECAKQIAGELETLYVERNGRSIEALSAELGVEGMVVVTSKKVSFVSRAGEFFFHPGMAGPRINELKNGKTDQMINAMAINQGNTVLDCTLGLGTDAIVASYTVGNNGRVVGLENSPVIAYLVKSGLVSYPATDRDTVAAMQRVEVVRADHRDYLRTLPAGSFDVVYFDPMFRLPGRRSPAMNALRALADPEPLDRETINLAVKIANKRV
ncbi:class I SAM-dependent methyltransferase, partial [Pelotomaculum sp. PtaB.Bin117]|uniref:class I SAM-dependent methyltransferase n=1 Tax=Pelotomaculum sp. PtaB.Bin117 TaxID=1811694 RepID=UPI00257C49ED